MKAFDLIYKLALLGMLGWIAFEIQNVRLNAEFPQRMYVTLDDDVNVNFPPSFGVALIDGQIGVKLDSRDVLMLSR